MKHDITSPGRILSREIKALFVVGVFLGLALPAFAATPPPTSDFETFITPAKLKSLPEKVRVIIDTRSAWKFMAGHIPGAINLSSWQDFSKKSHGVAGQIRQDKSFIAQKLSSLGIDHNKTIVIYGDLTDKWRTDGRFFWMFEFYGFKRTALLKGGYQQWQKAGFAIDRGFGDDPPVTALKVTDISLNREVVADQNWIATRLGSKEIAIIDNREKHEFEGATPYGSSRGGHIPGAIHIDWREFFDAQGMLKPKDKLASLLKSKGIRPDQEIVVYCTGGVRSAMAYFVFRYLGYTVRNYDGSWWDWSHNPKLPIES